MAVPEVAISVSLGFISGAACVFIIWYWSHRREEKKELDKLR